MPRGCGAPGARSPGIGAGPDDPVLDQAPVDVGRPQDTPDPRAAELAGWASGELPGQASQQLANWAAAESAPARTTDRIMDRSRTVH